MAGATNDPRMRRRAAPAFGACLAALTLVIVAGALPACGGPQHPGNKPSGRPATMTELLENAAQAAENRGEFAKAKELRERLVALKVRESGPTSLPVATALHNAAAVYGILGDYARAIAIFQSAIAIEEKVGGIKSLELASSSNELGRIYLETGAYPDAFDALSRAVGIRVGVLGWAHVDTAWSEISLGDFFRKTNNCVSALVLYDGAKKILEKVPGPGDVIIATTLLIGQAGCYEIQGDLTQAEGLYQRALAIRQQSEGPDGFAVAMSLAELGRFYEERGDATRAEPVLVRALGIFEKVRGSSHPAAAKALEALGLLYIDGKHDYARAEALLLRALAIREAAKNPENPAIPSVIHALAYLYWKMGDMERAFSALSRALEINERCISSAFNSTSRAPEGDRLKYFSGLDHEKNWIISFQAQHPTAEARRVALLTLLRRKGRELDLMGDMTRSLRSHLTSQNDSRFQQVLAAKRGAARREFEDLVQGSGPDEKQKRAVGIEVERLEAEIFGVRSDDVRGLNAAFRSAVTPLTLESVARNIPAGSALVEIAQYAPLDPRTGQPPSPPRYAAFVMRSDAAVTYVDLGDCATVDAKVARLRTALADPTSDPKPVARELGDRLLRPLRTALGPTRHLLLAPDAHLSELPFGALVDEQGDYLARNWSFTYLTTGRELVTLAASHGAASSAPLVIADPDFGPVDSGAAVASNRGIGLGDLRRVKFPALPATEVEGRAIAAALGAKLVTGAAATHDALANVHGPRVLHIATHGFFLQDGPTTSAPSRGLSLDTSSAGPTNLSGVDALFRSGLVLAGANGHRPNDTGVLTAGEALWLDLRGTELVVLSACETGLGEISAGQGVRGLQQALILAGARSLVMSLWKVDDAATSELMRTFYGSLGRGGARSEALRSAQLKMLATPERAHPYYWASFIQYGDGSPLAAPP